MESWLAQLKNCLVERVASKHDNLTHVVYLNHVRLGVLPVGMYSELMRYVITSPSMYLAQVGNIVSSVLIRLGFWITAIPVMIFWLGLFTFVSERELLLRIYTGLSSDQAINYVKGIIILWIVVITVVEGIVCIFPIEKLSFGIENVFQKRLEDLIRQYFGQPTTGRMMIVDSSISEQIWKAFNAEEQGHG